MTTVSEIFQTMAYGPAPESDKQAREWLAKHGGEGGVGGGGESGRFGGGGWGNPAGGGGSA